MGSKDRQDFETAIRIATTDGRFPLEWQSYTEQGDTGGWMGWISGMSRMVKFVAMAVVLVGLVRPVAADSGNLDVIFDRGTHQATERIVDGKAKARPKHSGATNAATQGRLTRMQTFWLSVPVPGLGQIVNRHPVKGAIWLLLEGGAGSYYFSMSENDRNRWMSGAYGINSIGSAMALGIGAAHALQLIDALLISGPYKSHRLTADTGVYPTQIGQAPGLVLTHSF